MEQVSGMTFQDTVRFADLFAPGWIERRARAGEWSKPSPAGNAWSRVNPSQPGWTRTSGGVAQ